MGLLRFDKLPVNTLVGADWKTFKSLEQSIEIDPAYRTKFRLTKAICRMMSVLKPLEDNRYKTIENKPLEMDPVFILGHWRSGTTFVHNVLALDKHFGYTTTYHTVMPHLMLFGQPFFKKAVSIFMPSKRPTDNMDLQVDLPQEEEFALSNMIPYNFYNFWLFPKHTMEYCDKYLLHNDINTEELDAFKETFLKLIKVSMENTGGSQYLSKNPPHTGRVKALLAMFPNAKFIYLKRNPYTVFESTRSFFTNTIQPLKMQDISNEQIETNIIDVYKKLFYKFEEEKKMIPSGNLLELKFEDFEADAFGMTKKIYDDLQIPGFEEAQDAIKAYLDKKKGYKKQEYKYDPRTIDIVESNWNMALEAWDYKL